MPGCPFFVVLARRFDSFPAHHIQSLVNIQKHTSRYAQFWYYEFGEAIVLYGDERLATFVIGGLVTNRSKRTFDLHLQAKRLFRVVNKFQDLHGFAMLTI